jgi:RDD family
MSTAPASEPGGGRPRNEPDHSIEARMTAIPPQARPFQGARAGLVSRVLANTVDFGVVAAILAGGYAVVSAVRFLWNSRTFSFPALPFGLLLILGAGVTVVYLAGAWSVTGRTYGDHLLGLRVIGFRDRPMRVGGALVRAALYVLFPIGLFWVAVSRENRSVQDVVLRTSVIYDWSTEPPERPTE